MNDQHAKAGISDSWAPHKKKRFRLRKRLTAALLQVLVVVGEMEKRKVTANRENVVTTDTVMKVMQRFLTHDPAKDNDEPVQVLASGKRAMELAMVRRLKETLKRSNRGGYRNRLRPPVAHGDRPAPAN